MKKKPFFFLKHLIVAILLGLIFRPVIVSAQTKGLLHSSHALKSPAKAVVRSKTVKASFRHLDRERPESMAVAPVFGTTMVFSAFCRAAVPSALSHPPIRSNSPLILRI
ncbi:MAG TPA: hypothetical protein VHE12_13255 [bacterium]|nr:hypothetical protein [bacterium]